jgi:hypothetical protein
MKKVFFAIFLGISLPSMSFAQMDQLRGQGLFVEILGSGVGVSMNYDSRFFQANGGLGARIGVGYVGFTLFDEDVRAISLPFQLNYLWGRGNHFLETGVGTTALFSDSEKGNGWWAPQEDDSTIGMIGTMTVGYRYQPVDGGFQLRAGLSPVFDLENFFYLWPHISFGFLF